MQFWKRHFEEDYNSDFRNPVAVEVFCEAITEEFFDSIIVKFLEMNPDLDQESLINDLNNELKLKISIERFLWKF